MFKSLRSLFLRLIFFENQPRYSRLKGSLTTYEFELENRIKTLDLKIDPTWAVEARKLTRQAEFFLNEYKIDEAWKCLHTAQRQEIFGMNDDERRKSATVLVSESEKLNKWRANAILALLGDPSKPEFKTPTASTLAQAMKLKDEHYNNIYYQNRLTRSLYLMLFVLLAITTVLVYCFANQCIYSSCKLPPHSTMLIGVILFGLLGAITSSILFTRNQAKYSRITEIATNKFIVLSKIAVGVGFTVFIYFLLRASFLDGIQLFSFSLTTDVDYYTVAFISGFTERIAQKAMSIIVGDEKPQETTS